jgi:hypothetical protein
LAARSSSSGAATGLMPSTVEEITISSQNRNSRERKKILNLLSLFVGGSRSSSSAAT